MAFGAIAGAGEAQVYSEGFRSEEAQVLALYFPDGQRFTAEVNVLATIFDVPLFREPENLKAFVEAIS